MLCVGEWALIVDGDSGWFAEEITTSHRGQDC
jgi:hypothetical protein